MRTGVLLLGLVLSFGGCGFSSPAGPDGSTSGSDGDACTSFSSQVDTCQLALDGDLTLSGTITYDTGTHELKVNGAAMPVAHRTLAAKAGDIDAILVHDLRLTMDAELRATGALPFAIVASGSVTVEGGALIDVSNGGAGALPVCSNPPKPGEDNTGGGGGGGGGGYGASGGNGGQGNKDGTHSSGGAQSPSIAMPPGPRGGCPGAHGGSGDSPPTVGGLSGLGGGAVYIAAVERIELLGSFATLTAGGGGGHGGPQGSGTSGDSGGGGGGSGGMIWLEAPHVLGSQGQVAANGGGGGEGSNDQASGHNGEPGSVTTSQASGGTGGAPDGADGGRGGSLEGPMGETVTALLNAGGGGGGGGVGYIHFVSADVQLGSVSPDPQ